MRPYGAARSRSERDTQLRATTPLRRRARRLARSFALADVLDDRRSRMSEADRSRILHNQSHSSDHQMHLSFLRGSRTARWSKYF
eukprot:3093989-Prymnesium_polylepis.3